jgi:hypothetical protein
LDGLSESTGTVSNPPWLLSLGLDGDLNIPPDVTNGVDDRHWGLPPDALGLALSGEGIQSAAFCLGVLQAMARAGWLRHVDYLSTVSGGGYIGAFLGRYFDSYRMRRGEPDPAPGVVQTRVARGLVDPDSAPVDWLRRHSNYLALGGANDAAVNVVGYLRNLLSVYLVLGVLFLAVFGSLDAVGYLSASAVSQGGVSGAPTSSAYAWIVELLPISHNLPAVWRGPWLALAEGSLWLAVAPLLLAYWLVSQDLPESFVAPILISAAVAAGTSLLLTGSPLVLVILVASVLWSMASWAAARQEEGPADPHHPYRRMLAREHLNRRLTFWATLTVVLVALWVIDCIGRSLARLMPYGDPTVGSVAWRLSGVGAVVLAMAWTLGAVVRSFATGSSRTGRTTRAGQSYLWFVAALVLGALPFLVATSFVSHFMYGVGGDYPRGLAVTVVAAVVSLLFGTRECLPLINQSGTISIQAGRLARTFFGAVTPARRVHPEGEDVTRSVAGDDVPFDQYHPELVSGPLHLINCAVNETFDVASFRVTQDRGAENLAVGPVGVSLARVWHALWTSRETSFRSLEPLGTEAPDPFLNRNGGPARVEPLGLEDWVAISGAMSGAGDVWRTGGTLTRLQALSGFRSGYWWDSGLDARERTDTPIRGGLLSTLGASLARVFRGQTLLLSELTGRFGGPWTRHWYLSNGGAFDCTGAYELLRRRLPFIIICDANADPKHRGPALARLVRLARVDLGAEVTETDLDCEALEQLGVPKQAAEHLGSLEDLSCKIIVQSRKRATLLRVRYSDAPSVSDGDPWLARRRSWILYIKTTYTGDEPVDVRSYAAAHPDFPNETTLDQVFDEPQWESYRRLGEHIGDRLFVLPVSALR